MGKLTWGKNVYATFLLCSQANCTDGANPFAEPVLGTDRDFYGTTFIGGLYGDGTVFKITSGGALTTLHSFDFRDGSEPVGALIQGIDGNFYGTTQNGGASSSGTVFEITPGGMLTTLHSFCFQTNCPDGSVPDAPLVQATNGDFYGTTLFGPNSSASCFASGCGTVFKITPRGTLTTLHSFDGTDGADPTTG